MLETCTVRIMPLAHCGNLRVSKNIIQIFEIIFVFILCECFCLLNLFKLNYTTLLLKLISHSNLSWLIVAVLQGKHVKRLL